MKQQNHHPDKLRALEGAIQTLQRQYGAGAILRLDGSVAEHVGAPISTGSHGLDQALGVGGLPRGRMVEIYGPEASGKTTLALQAIASVQRDGGIAAIVDAEHALDPTYAAALGVDLPKLLIAQPDSGEQALEITEQLIRSGAVDLLVVDSVAALVPEAEISGDMGDLQVGLQARMMSKAMRKLTSVVARTRCCAIFINQLRAKIGGMGFGPKEVTTGGNALKYYTSVRIDIRRIGQLKDREGNAVGNRTRAKVVKNKMAAPFRKAEFEILFGKGVCRTGELIDMGLELGLLTKSGSWFSLGDERLGQGREKVRERLESEPDLMKRLEDIVLGGSHLTPPPAEA
ncbi:MAG: recombinase RecA [Proteobacteria bacterium]|nr:recombinase RecA [Pseudomonadota bacterium]MCP4916110.1 recombinase RecA [Pseudomonadota bacterium]